MTNKRLAIVAISLFLLFVGFPCGNYLRAQYPFKFKAQQFDSIHNNFTKQWNDPEVEQRISSGIKLNRMGFATFSFKDENGKPIKNVEVSFEQTKHAFLFGCNLFMLKGFKTVEENKRYEDAFSSVFNMAVVPFYWSDMEPEQGKIRYAKDCPPVYRRPTPDLCVEFCKKNDIVPKGHLLIWHQWLPTWLPDSRSEVKELMLKRFEEISARYGKDIKYWDVIDEALHRKPETMLPEDYVYTSIQEAARIFPSDSRFDIGDDMSTWKDTHLEDSPYYEMLRILQLRNAPLDAVGFCFQAHFLPKHQYDPTVQPLAMFKILDLYSKFQRPMQFTQVTLGELKNDPDAEKKQAEVVRNMYRLWFSYPNMEVINWWNLSDNTAAPSENACLPGLLNEDLSPKLAFKELYNLIKKEWWTNVKTNSGLESEI
ncbi:MAG: endo-1,4-beta-xylanase, partial [Bacteroidota bacterium]